MEQHHECALVPHADTEWMSEYSFGKSPRADTCENVEINCIYDENLGDTQPIPRWFEIESGSSIFDISVSPVTSEELLKTEFKEVQILKVEPATE